MYLLSVPESNDPSFNLAVEEFAVRNLDLSKDYFFVYEDAPAVVIGKHQNPFVEINLAYCRKNQIPLYRRISGGGTVYHGPGNINFTFFTKNTESVYNNYRRFLEPMVKLLRDMGADVEINERNDLVIDGKKISGNAQFTSRDRLLCHGTLLFDSDLDVLRQSLRAAAVDIETRATASVRSSVTNVMPHLSSRMDITQFKERLIRAVLGYFGDEKTFSLREDQMEALNKLRGEKFSTWEWNWGLTPKFKVKLENKAFGLIHVNVENGRIQTIETKNASGNKDMLRLFASMGETQYTPEAIDRTLTERFVPQKMRDQIVSFIYPF